jgi:recombination protein RecA
MRKEFDSFLDEVRKSYDSEVIVTAKSELDVIPTGITSLDASIGVGGIPRARMTEIYGPEGAGKTTLALGICKHANEQGLKVLYIDIENMLDYEYAHTLVGELDTDRFIILQPDTGEDALKLARKGIQSGEFGVVILDSVGAIAPDEEKKKDIEDQQYALVPKLITKFLRMVAYDVRVNNVALVFINQVRDTIGSYVKSYSVPGGHALKHFCSVIVQLKKGEQIKVGSGDDVAIVGINVSFTVVKNKLAAPFRSAVIPLMFGKGVDELRDLVSFADMIGVLQKAGSYYKYGDVVLGRGMVNSIEFLNANKETIDNIKKSCYNVTVTDKHELIDEDAENLEKGVEDE